MMQIYHNPRCGKSRNCLAFLENKNIEFEIIKYLETPPTVEQLTILLKKLNLEPQEIVRQKEKLWVETYKNKNLNNQELIEILVANPILIERPIVINQNRAIIGREFDKLEAFVQE
ncbi:arsenate reductase (glutaredoxin) [Flavobacterium faecale]|uniref:arsenate reductase (glutaredoxin) n=1 Tax=Flavobacterium faecale TaxID=1355330 RepID=UPI003AAD174F